MSVLSNNKMILLNVFNRDADGRKQCKQPTPGVMYNKFLNQKIYIDIPHGAKLYKNQIFTITFDEKQFFAFLREIQKHPTSEKIIHIDLFVADETSGIIKTRLPINFIDHNQSDDLKLGAFLYITSRSIPVKMHASSVIPFVNVSLAGMKNGDNIRSANIVLPEGIENMRKDITIATLMASKGG